MDIYDVTFEDFTGVSSGANDDEVARLVCSDEAVCEGITLSNIHISAPETYPEDGIILCDGISGGIGVPCESADSISD